MREETALTLLRDSKQGGYMDLLLEKGLEHQEKPVRLIADVFKDIDKEPGRRYYENPVFDLHSRDSLDLLRYHVEDIQLKNNIIDYRGYSSTGEYLSIDIKMETGTGKTYVYTHTMYELFKRYGINKFIIIVPTLPIKAGTRDFISDPYVRRHFRDERGYKTDIDLCVLEATKTKKKKGRNFFPNEVRKFVEGTLHDKNRIYVLLTNMALLTSGKVLRSEKYDSGVEGFYKPFDAIAATHPFVIIDEPHKFKESGKTFQSITENLKPQCIIRFGATYPEHSVGKGKKPVKDYHNLIYDLNAYESFRQNLIKGVAKEHVGTENNKNGKVKLTEFAAGRSNYAKFTLYDGANRPKGHFELSTGESLSQIDDNFSGISITGISKKYVSLSNGKDLNKDETLFVDSYSVSYQEQMLALALERHFEIERENFARSPRIRTLALFFIEDIDSFREDSGNPWLRDKFETLLKEKIKRELKGKCTDEYRSYLEASLDDVKGCVAGYFARDNQDTDENIEKEVCDILEGKKRLLQFKDKDGNWILRRFLFSKWTLKEGWDNPNVFTICKLRSSGSEISKMQEVGRGLRLPVDETGRRVKDEDFMLNYIVDKSEANFANDLVNEINGELQHSQQMGRFSLADIIKVATDRGVGLPEMLGIMAAFVDYEGSEIVVKKDKMQEFLETFPELRPKDYKPGKIKNRNKDGNKPIHIIKERFDEIAELWKHLNTRYILTFQKDIDLLLEKDLPDMLVLTDHTHIETDRIELEINDEKADLVRESGMEMQIYSNHIPYGQYLRRLSGATSVPVNTLHRAIVEYSKSHKDEDTKAWFSDYSLNRNITLINNWFKQNLMGLFKYRKTDFVPNDTQLTIGGKPKETISAGLIGLTIDKDTHPLETYLYDTVAYDSPLEHKNILNKVNVARVIVFGKIPKKSISIPTIATSSYSPDFMYIVEKDDGTKVLNLVVETKNVDDTSDLRPEENVKIACAEKFFEAMRVSGIDVQFRKQLKAKSMGDIIRELITG